MGILTNFLKLLKPDENDYYNAITEQAGNWQKIDDWAKGIDDSNKKKLDKGNVSAEYDTAKKIEDKIKEVKKTADDKLDKGNIPADWDSAEKIKGKVEEKQSITDESLNVVSAGNEKLQNVIRAINYSYNKNGHGSMRNSVLGLDDIRFSGFWYMYDNKYQHVFGTSYIYLMHTNYNESFGGGAFQLACSEHTTNLFFRTSEGNMSGSYRYTPWTQVLDINNKYWLGAMGTNEMKYIQADELKEKNNIYIDKVTGKPYRCLENTKSIDITDDLFLPVDLLNNSLFKSKRIFQNTVSAEQTYTIEDISKFKMLLFRGRYRDTGTVVLVDEYLSTTTSESHAKGSFAVTMGAIDATGIAYIGGQLLSNTAFKINFLARDSAAFGFYNYLEIIGVY